MIFAHLIIQKSNNTPRQTLQMAMQHCTDDVLLSDYVNPYVRITLVPLTKQQQAFGLLQKIHSVINKSQIFLKSLKV